MQNRSNFNNNFEEEITNKLEEIDRHADRSGWPFLIIAIAIFFLLVFIAVKLFSIPTSKEFEGNQLQLSERITQLEDRIKSLENLIQKQE